MANTFAVPRNHLIFGLCLPIAVLLGYLLAEPLDSGSLAVLVMVVSVLCVPLMMKWHHALLIVTWNAYITPYFFPGQLPLWMLVAWASLFFALLGRSVSPDRLFLNVPAVTFSLLFFGLVVTGTAIFSGGFGFKALGSESYGGRRYLYLFTAIAGYFALSSQAIPTHRACWYVALFFLSGVTAGVSNLIYAAGSRFYFLYQIFPVDLAMDQAAADFSPDNAVGRITGLFGVSQALTSYLLARYGVAGVLEISRPWRGLMLMASIALGLFTGFRSCLIFTGLLFLALFWVEGLWKTRFAFVLVGLFALGSATLVLTLDRLPLSVQRTLSFLPLKVDPRTLDGARYSTEWRLEMWRNVLPDVPKYLLKGKGYALNPRELAMIEDASRWGFGRPTEGAELAGDYHNGPLSVVIAFGLYGVVALLWFWAAALRVLHRNCRYGDPALRTFNQFLLAAFLARVIFFVFLYGSISADFFVFTGLVGMSVALNRGEARPQASPPGQEFGLSNEARLLIMK